MAIFQKSPARRRRGLPATAPVIDLQERDLDLIECILRLGGHLPADLIALQFWHDVNSDPARRRLRKLLDGKLLSATLVGSRCPNVYFVTRRGLDALVAERPDASDLKLPEPVRTIAGLRHRRLVSMMRLYLAALGEAGFGELMRWSGGRSSVAIDLQLATAQIAPDGIAQVQLGDTDGVVLVEADAGTETEALRHKLARYERYLAGRKRTELWLLAAGGGARLATVRSWCTDAGVTSFTRVFSEQDVMARPATVPVARLSDISGDVAPETAGGGQA